MLKKGIIPLGCPDRGSLTRVFLVALLALFSLASAHARTSTNHPTDPQAYNKDVRTGTWSIYAQGGLSWVNGLWYQNVDAKKSYSLSPAVGGGVDYTIRPWVRVGAEYLWSRYRGEQRFSQIEATMPMKLYGNYLMNYHKAQLGVDFNFMEFWPQRKAQWFNVWVGTGVGYMMAKGNEYQMTFNTTVTEPSARSVTDVTIDNGSSTITHTVVKTTNEHSSFNQLYLPLSLNMEFDVSRRFTLGLKGEMDWMVNRKDIAPKNLIFGLATVRYNFVPSKAQQMKACYENALAGLNDEVNELRKQAQDEKARAAAERQQWAEEKAALQRQLNDCEQRSAVVVEKPTHTVQFDHNSSYFSKEEGEALKAFAQQHAGKKLSLVAEASKPGDKGYNQALSERRLMRVIKALQEAGFAEEDLKPSIAIGAQRGIDSAEARRVTITVE